MLCILASPSTGTQRFTAPFPLNQTASQSPKEAIGRDTGKVRAQPPFPGKAEERHLLSASTIGLPCVCGWIYTTLVHSGGTTPLEQEMQSSARLWVLMYAAKSTPHSNPVHPLPGA